MTEQLAIIKGVGFGNRDVGRPVLFFETYLSEGIGALQILSDDEAMNFIKAYGVYDVKDLEGKPVWIEREGFNTIKVLRPWRQ